MKEYLFTKMKWLIFVAWNLINDVKIFFYSVRPYQMCIKCTWEYAYHNASKSDANVRVLVVIRLRKSMHTDLKYPYVSTWSDALWHMRRGVEWWLIFQLFCFILWRFIFTVYKKMACVEWQDEMTKIKEQKL